MVDSTRFNTLCRSIASTLVNIIDWIICVYALTCTYPVYILICMRVRTYIIMFTKFHDVMSKSLSSVHSSICHVIIIHTNNIFQLHEMSTIIYCMFAEWTLVYCILLCKVFKCCTYTVLLLGEWVNYFISLLVMVDWIIFFVAKFNTSFSGELHSACAKEQVSVN